ncbi:uncharacterized protein LOC119545961 isoform X1 [Drosophila subpulchrella]|uniref:uncharacterized protein LOC119545961 isoform X1 n=1 Tax=Drosophila subpulchrella TaxID=1486046 RepID=UPI0018A1A2EE|nr:uncharacterized protein LOC119545961 isoform X1 [Drosophila subpulchrella]
MMTVRMRHPYEEDRQPSAPAAVPFHRQTDEAALFLCFNQVGIRAQNFPVVLFHRHHLDDCCAIRTSPYQRGVTPWMIFPGFVDPLEEVFSRGKGLFPTGSTKADNDHSRSDCSVVGDFFELRTIEVMPVAKQYEEAVGPYTDLVEIEEVGCIVNRVAITACARRLSADTLGTPRSGPQSSEHMQKP